MQPLRLLVSLLAGVAVFGLSTLAVTETLNPYIWPSLLVGLPIGVVLGVSTALVTYVGGGYWTEQRDAGTVSPRTRRRLRATLAAVVTGIVVGGAGVALLASQAVGVALALLVGLAVGLVAAALAASLVWYVGRERGDKKDANRTRG